MPRSRPAQRPCDAANLTPVLTVKFLLISGTAAVHRHLTFVLALVAVSVRQTPAVLN